MTEGMIGPYLIYDVYSLEPKRIDIIHYHSLSLDHSDLKTEERDRLLISISKEE